MGGTGFYEDPGFEFDLEGNLLEFQQSSSISGRQPSDIGVRLDNGQAPFSVENIMELDDIQVRGLLDVCASNKSARS